MAKAANYAVGYNAFRANMRISLREEAQATEQQRQEEDFQRNFMADNVGFQAPPDNSPLAKRMRARKKAELEARRDAAERTYGTRDLRRVPNGGEVRDARVRDQARGRREALTRARRAAAQARKKRARSRG